MFGFQKLDVYRCAVTFLGVASALAERVPRRHSELADQPRRAALSVPLNIAEDSGKGTMDSWPAARLAAPTSSSNASSRCSPEWVARSLLERADLLLGRARLGTAWAA